MFGLRFGFLRRHAKKVGRFFFVMVSIGLVVSIVALVVGNLYSNAVVGEAQAQPSRWNQIFFAVQTITTTGYGSEIYLKGDSLQRLATGAMLLGATIWGVAISALWSALRDD